MNNLKRVLSLGLIGTMLSGMMVMGASAADFTDADKIQHSEAVNVLAALKIIDGKPDGSFDPEGNVTRAEMAKMIAVAMNGGSDANTGTKLTPSFTDIGGHWAESYIEYCADLGIISGRGDGTFDPGANVTGLEAAKMVLTALGFDATAYKLTGATWAVRTDAVVRTQTGIKVEGADEADPSLYEDLTSTVLATAATRDTAAQLIWNGLQNHTRKVTPSTNTSNGEVTWSYDPGEMMLTERYGAKVWKGTYEGNDKSLSALDNGQIRVNGKLSTASAEAGTRNADFVSDMGIENIGEEVKVVFKDATGGTSNVPDKKDTIYGVFNTGKTEVYNLTKSQLQDAGSSDKNSKVKFGDSKHDAAGSTISVVTNYMGDAVDEPVSKFSDNSASGYRLQSVDQIKFTCDEDGKIEKAYIVEVKAGKVTSITASKITVSGVGAVDIADNDVAEGLAKDDVVVYTKLYDTDRDDAFFTFTKAETVEGELTGYKNSDNIVIEGTTYAGRRNNADGDTLYRYTVAVNRDDEIEINVDAQTVGDVTLGSGVVITFDEAADGEYAASTDITVIKTGATDWTYGAVKEYNESSLLLSYYTATSRGSANEGYVGTEPASSITVDKDVKIVYVNTDDEEDGSEIGVGAFDTSTGYANVVFHTDDDGVVDVIIVETSDKAFKGESSGNFGKKTTYAVNTPAAVTAGTNNGAYTATVSPTSPVEGGVTVTVTVTCGTAPANGTDTVSITSASDVSTITGATKTVSAAGTVGTWTFTMPSAEVDDLTITVVNSED